ncbi:HipA N-terminal domain-containing protein [Paramicrobacterium agarici]|uniref:HipA N-terminal domain-containing protein n=1 Tax=Paramicrobacterium agarici TaxID=630514 RepID=UPI000BF6DDFD
MVTDRNLDVYLGGQFSGVLAQSPAGNVTFDYDEEYRVSESATPLSLAMPLVTPTHRKRAVLPWLQGLLPDNRYCCSDGGRCAGGAEEASARAELDHSATVFLRANVSR